MTFRSRSIIIIALLLMTASIVNFYNGELQEVPIKKPLSSFPDTIDVWKIVDKVVLQYEVINMLGVDEYAEKIYKSADNKTIDLYISYFNVLKEGKQFHSPKNCLVGSGSKILSSGVVEIPLKEGKKHTAVNIMEIQNGDQRQIVLYWFQCRGRIITSEYMERIYRVLDAFFMKRNDGAFIRLITTFNDGKVDETRQTLMQFTSLVIPILDLYIPGSKLD